MVESDIPHAGIELDAICLPALGLENDDKDAGQTLSDPSNYKLFVNSIFKKMMAQDSFLSFSRQISNVNKILAMKYSSANDIADVIRKDMALTSKVLKLVNSSYYRHFSTKGISTISEAMIILGTEEVRSAAASLKIFEMMSGLANAEILRDKALKGLQRSLMARQIALEGDYKDADGLEIAAMIHDLGEYLVALFAPDKYIRIEVVMDDDNLSLQAASRSVLGISYNELGRLVALKLHLPETIVDAMRTVTKFNFKGEEVSEAIRRRYACAFTREMCDLPKVDDNGKALDQARLIAAKYKDILNIDMLKSLEIAKTSRDKVIKHAALLNIDSDLGSVPASSGVKNMDSLNAGLRQLQENIDNRLSIHEIFTNIVGILSDSFYFTRVCIAIKKKETRTMDARFVKGDDSREFFRRFSFKLDNTSDVFNSAVAGKKHVIVRDIKGEQYKKNIPSWYMEQFEKNVESSAFAVFPVFVEGKIISMIYVSWDGKAHSMNRELVEYMKQFRDFVAKTFVFHSRKYSK
jgi:HD-like signal output (HDOD) protein